MESEFIGKVMLPKSNESAPLPFTETSGVYVVFVKSESKIAELKINVFELLAGKVTALLKFEFKESDPSSKLKVVLLISKLTGLGE